MVPSPFFNIPAPNLKNGENLDEATLQQRLDDLFTAQPTLPDAPPPPNARLI